LAVRGCTKRRFYPIHHSDRTDELQIVLMIGYFVLGTVDALQPVDQGRHGVIAEDQARVPRWARRLRVAPDEAVLLLHRPLPAATPSLAVRATCLERTGVYAFVSFVGAFAHSESVRNRFGALQHLVFGPVRALFACHLSVTNRGASPRSMSGTKAR
jgi:hypothetical protein